MTKRLTLYALFILAIALQLLLMTRIPWIPDIVLIMVVFAGIFRGPIEGLFAGLVAGVIRGLFSVDSLPVDVFLFPAVGVLVSALSNLFYRQNVANQMLLMLTAIVTVIAVHTSYFNHVSGNDISVLDVLAKSWNVVLLTFVASPFIFAYLRFLWQEED
ncbi:MAG: hypothetical protein WC482_05780 [Candidatus Omnitrophota bacterium]|jgi:rod shape-determining protein MreD